jgi:transcriptional regulator with XRE-family HTH domain
VIAEIGGTTGEPTMAKFPGLTPEAIQQFRRERGLSQQELAAILGVGVATVSRWETGQASATGTAAIVLQTVITAAHTGLTPDLWLGSGNAIYQLLRDVFDPADTTTLLPIR